MTGVARDILVLSYHAVSRTWPAALAVTPEQLDRQLRKILEHGYRSATVGTAVHRPTARRTFSMTFDDAFSSVYELAFPLMEHLGATGTVFVPTSYADSGRPISWKGMEHWVGTRHERELQPMSWAQLRELRDAGWEIGSHTVSHPRLSELDDERLAAELHESRARCQEALGGACDSLAYPYGDHDDRVVQAARAAGFKTGCTVPARLSERDPLRWPRIGVYRLDTPLTFGAKVSPSLRRLRSSSMWPPIARAILRARGRQSPG